MAVILSLLILGLRVFISIKTLFLLGKCYFYPETYSIDGLKWYVCFFIFDMWFMKINTMYYEPKVSDEDKGQNN